MKEAGFAVDHVVDGEDGLHLALTGPYVSALIGWYLAKAYTESMNGVIRVGNCQDQGSTFTLSFAQQFFIFTQPALLQRFFINMMYCQNYGDY